MNHSAIDVPDFSSLGLPNLSTKIMCLNRNPHYVNDLADIFQGHYIESETKVINVAVKRHRLYLNLTECTKVSSPSLLERSCKAQKLIRRDQCFEDEIYAWSRVSRLDHPNILLLLGYAFLEDNGCPLLISPWMPFGSAWAYMEKYPETGTSEIVRMVSLLLELMRDIHL